MTQLLVTLRLNLSSLAQNPDVQQPRSMTEQSSNWNIRRRRTKTQDLSPVWALGGQRPGLKDSKQGCEGLWEAQ